MKNVKPQKSPSESSVTPVDKLQESWAKVYPVVEHWQSDMKFFEDELRFLHLLVDKYFMGLIKEKNISKTRVLAKKLFGMEPRRKNLDQQLTKHMLHIQEIFENPFSHDSHVFEVEHVELEKEVSMFIKDFRAIKREAFAIIDQVITDEMKKVMM